LRLNNNGWILIENFFPSQAGELGLW